MNERISGAQFKQMLLFGAAAITLEKQAINDLNVFPVPDGDTGTNMSLTIQAAAAELKKSEPATIGEAASITASALLRSARGNSGVILSLLFRGMSKVLKGQESADGALLAAALQEGVATAYSAVMKPAEGTVLTVSRLAAQHAAELAKTEHSAEVVLAAALEEGQKTLAATIDMNPVLKKAGVVDAGGKGYLVILEGMLRALRGEAIPEVGEVAAVDSSSSSAFEKFETEDIRFTYCTEFIVQRAGDKEPDQLRRFLSELGDSLVLVDDDEIIKVHVHTNHPGRALEEALTYGSLVTTKIENMKNQHSEILSELQEAAPAEVTDVPAEKPYGFLSVCAGEGLAALFRDLGVDGVISGGQTMNPSTECILDAIRKTPAETVFVLPNNKNIVMAAQQCQGLTEKQVLVIPTHSIPQGISAMMAVNLEADDAETIAEAMTAALQKVTTAQVTYAARNSDFDGFAIKEGDYLLLKEGRLFGTGAELTELLTKLAQEPVAQEAAFISLFYGEDVSEEDARQVQAIFAEHCPEAELLLLRGGQPVYYYIISME